jgi:HlyD family secretion protein
MQQSKMILRLLQTKRSILMTIAVVVVIVGIIALLKWPMDPEQSGTDFPTAVVKRGPLTISITESGTIKSREQIIIKNEVEGKTTILSLVSEGTKVQKGDMLVELDSSKLLDQKVDLQIQEQNAEAAFIRAREDLAVAENQAKSDVNIAELTLDFAKQDLKKYIEGEYPNELKEAEARITLAQEELQRVEETLKWSEKLAQEKYLSQTELQADELAVSKKRLDLELAKNNRDLLENFTHGRKLAELESNVKQAEMALERTTRKARADVVQAEAELKAKESEFERQKDKLKKNEEEIKKTKIYAPADGMVVYATSAKSGGFRHLEEPLKEGQEIRELQELIYLPTASSVKAEIKIHESSLEKVRVGLPAKVTVDALPGKSFAGVVAKIAVLPDAESMFLNPDIKIYSTDIYLNGDGSTLRTGMSCRTEVIIEQYEDAIYIPVQAVLRIGGRPTVYVVKDNGFEPRKVEVGLDNSRMVRVVNGLQAGETVLLTPPLGAASVEPAAGKEAEEASPGENAPETETEGLGTTGDDKSRLPEAGEASTAEQREKKRERLEKMSPEEREKMRQRFESMSDEEKEKMRQERMKGQQ